MDVNPVASKPPPIAESSSGFDDDADRKVYIPKSGTASHSLEAKSLVDRSAIQTQKISGPELRKLIFEQNFSHGVHYRVEGDVSLAGNTDLEALPGNLCVGGTLYLRGCTSLTTLPENLSLGDDLNLEGCISLTALPDWITTLGPAGYDTRVVYLDNTGLSDALIDRLRTVRARGIRFHFSMRARQAERQFSNPEQGFAFWRELASSDAAIPKLDLNHDQAVDLARFLGRLTSTADYKNRATRPILARRVMKVMSSLAGDDRVRDDALRRIHDALSSCDDRVILTLDDLETLQLLITAETLAFKNRDARKLSAIGLLMMRLDKVRQIARDHMKTLN